MSLIEEPKTKIKKDLTPVSLFQLFSVGIGPSSSHTVGPMRAARLFSLQIEARQLLSQSDYVTVELFGSLAMTGKGHATDVAVLLGLEGEAPESIDPERISESIARIRCEGALQLLGKRRVEFVEADALLFHRGKRLPYHSNAMRCTAYDSDHKPLLSKLYYSVGGGFVVDHDEMDAPPGATVSLPHPFATSEQLLSRCQERGAMIYDIVWENERVWRSDAEIRAGILHIWRVMQACVARGIEQEGILPGGLNVQRRAAGLFRSLSSEVRSDPAQVFEWTSLFALAVNEENAAGGRVVTAPTNGAAGIIPAVLHYYQRFTQDPTEEGIVRFFLTATAMGILCKEGASLSAAEMGCQGEVGTACSMAAAGLVAALGGSNAQIENAAEIGIEHNLGLTCDPVGGLVQIPCIERNTMGAVKAINAARLALRGDGTHRVTLDQAIAAMRDTGRDMNAIYKETSEGGLAIQVPVNLAEC